MLYSHALKSDEPEFTGTAAYLTESEIRKLCLEGGGVVTKVRDSASCRKAICPYAPEECERGGYCKTRPVCRKGECECHIDFG